MKEMKFAGVRVRPTGIRNYWVSECGDVFNYVDGELRLMKYFYTKDGHTRIELKIEKGVSKKFFVHRLVYKAFVGELEDGLVIEHKNSKPYSNYYKNLNQCTQSNNIKTAVKANRWNQNKKKVKLFDKRKEKYVTFDSIKEIYEKLSIPNNNNSLNKLLKHSKFKKRYDFIECM